jgi:hypothetical protein
VRRRRQLGINRLKGDMTMTPRIICICLAAVLSLLPFTAYALGQADIAITDITVNSNCNWIITVKNVGTTELPVTALDQYYGTGIQIQKNGVDSSGWRFGSAVKMPGSVAQFTLSPSNADSAQVNGTVTLGAIFKPNGSYEDTNPANNSLSKILTCTPPPRSQPDLVITSLDFTPDCRARIVVKNIGTLAVPDHVFQRLYLQRKLDNVPAGQVYLYSMTPNGGCKIPQGSSEFTDYAEYVPQQTIQYTITASGIWFDESNSNNNSATVNLPDRCKPGAALKRVQPQYKGPVQRPIETPLKPGQKPVPKLP